MPILSEARIAEILRPYLFPPGLADMASSTLTTNLDSLYASLSSYLDLLLRWNARTNLTAVRSPEEIVRRHYGESLFAARILGSASHTSGPALDFGSGAGFPGIPVQLLLPELTVVLAESQRKKASFLREAVRSLGIRAEVWDGRVEDLPSTRTFSLVMLRAVDKMAEATAKGVQRVADSGVLLEMVSHPGFGNGVISRKVPETDASWVVLTPKMLLSVPRGTPNS